MTILFRPQGALGWFSYTTSWDTIADGSTPKGVQGLQTLTSKEDGVLSVLGVPQTRKAFNCGA